MHGWFLPVSLLPTHRGNRVRQLLGRFRACHQRTGTAAPGCQLLLQLHHQLRMLLRQVVLLTQVLPEVVEFRLPLLKELQ